MVAENANVLVTIAKNSLVLIVITPLRNGFSCWPNPTEKFVAQRILVITHANAGQAGIAICPCNSYANSRWEWAILKFSRISRVGFCPIKAIGLKGWQAETASEWAALVSDS